MWQALTSKVNQSSVKYPITMYNLQVFYNVMSQAVCTVNQKTCYLKCVSESNALGNCTQACMWPIAVTWPIWPSMDYCSPYCDPPSGNNNNYKHFWGYMALLHGATTTYFPWLGNVDLNIFIHNHNKTVQ